MFVSFFVYLCIFMVNFWIPIVVLILFAVGMIIIAKCYRCDVISSKLKGILAGLLIGVIIPCMIIFSVLQSDFVKARKNVDKEWMIGKTLDQIEDRYSCPIFYKDPSRYVPYGIDISKWKFCAREVYRYIDYEDEYLYFAKLDSSGKVCDVMVFDNNYDFPGAVIDHSYDKYEDRWGEYSLIYRVLQISPSFRGTVDNKMNG